MTATEYSWDPDAAWLRSVQIEPPADGSARAHHCYSMKHLAELEAYIRGLQEWHQQQAQWVAEYRQGIVLCLHDHHHLSDQAVADLLGLDRSRAQQIRKGKT